MRLVDPLSPLLFCIAEEVLSRGILDLVAQGKLSQMQASRNNLVPSHCLYADDILIICKVNINNVKHIMELFESYGSYSGQISNNIKSTFYSKSIPLSRLCTIAGLTGFKHASMPFTYMGILLFKGNLKVQHFQPIVDRICSKLASWKGHLVTIIGRVQLVNSVVIRMLVYSFHVYVWPISLIKQLRRMFTNFIWSGDTSTKKI